MTRGPTAGPHVAAFLRSYCRHTKGRWAGQPVECEVWQSRLLDEVFALDTAGRRIYTTAITGVPRKNGKSVLAAGAALYLLGPDGEPGPEVIVGSGSREQAGVVFDQAKAFVETSPVLGDWFTAHQYAVVCTENRGILRRVSADGRLQHGLNPHGVVLDELHTFTTPRQVELYAAMATAMGARAEPLLWGITTAGSDLETILGEIYLAALALPGLERPGGKRREKLRAGLSIARDPRNGFILVWYGADDGADIENPAVWRACNPASWITDEYLRRQLVLPTMDEGTFRRLHLNMWTSTKDAWFRPGEWIGLASGLAVPARVCVAVDVGITRDTTGVAWAGVDPETGRRVIRTRVWSARDDVPHDVFVPGGRVKLTVVTDFIRDLASAYDVAVVLYDPRHFEGEAERLSDDGLTVAPLVQSSAPMADAYDEFYAGVRTGELTHDGNGVLAAHVEGTAAVRTERGWKVSKIKSSRRIDACVAACMANYGAKRYTVDTPSYVIRA